MRGRPRMIWALAAALTLLPAFALHAQEPSDVVGLPILEVRVEEEGRRVTERLVTSLIQTTPGEPLSMRDVRQTIDHLMSIGRFEDVQPTATRSGAGVVLTYVLSPLHPIEGIEFEGPLGIREDDLRQAVVERHGERPSAGRADDVVRTLEVLYRERGYPQAQVASEVRQQHDPDSATLVFRVDPGPRAQVASLSFESVAPTQRAELLDALDLAVGDPLDSRELAQRLERYERRLRERGYYEARATHSVSFENAAAAVTVTVERGPRVTVAFAGDRLSEDVRRDLVPVQREGSVDEDLLEDANRAIEAYLHQRGYRDALVGYMREERDGELVITFTVNRGPRHLVEAVSVEGNTAMPAADVLNLLRLQRDEPFVEEALDAGAAAVTNAYRAQGFTRVAVKSSVEVLPSEGGPARADRRVRVVLAIEEGPRTLVGSIALEGNTVVAEGQLREVMTSAPGRPFSEMQVAGDRDRIQLEYLNRGYRDAVVDPHATMTDSGTRADLRFAISEGPQILVDHVIIVGNERTDTRTIERELLLKPGQPLGYAALLESQRRLSALGLFRRVRITELQHGSEPTRDVLVQVEEGPATSVGYGGGVEGRERLRPTGAGGQAEERFEFAPHGFFEIGRRNLWGKNRAVNLFTRVTLRERDIVFGSGGLRLDEPEEEGGFNEYRVVATYREPKVLGTAADVLVTGIVDQAIRSSFNFITREARLEAGLRLSPIYSLAGRYSYEHTELFDERFTPEEKPLIDRHFSQVRLSKFAGSILRDTRNDVLEPDRGMFLAADADLAARALGSEVGFIKTYLQAFTFHRLPTRRQAVVALAARVGAAHGFPRPVPEDPPRTGADGGPLVEVVQDLPASERFFAGGDTTVRGFSLDRLGTAATISPSGFPKGGNGLVVLNAELRVGVWRGLGMVGFLDAGNVFQDATDLNVADLRAAAGLGLRYRSPVGPVRIDLGFKLDRRELVAGRLERRTVLHISLGQAF